jgi:hypothetical protein
MIAYSSLKSDTSHLCKYLDREQKDTGENDKEKQEGCKILEKYKRNENRLEHSKIFTDNGEAISPENAAPTHGIEVVAQETMIKGKMILILPRCKASYTQEIGETDADLSRRCERLFQCERMCEPVLGAPAIPLKILWTDLEQYWFGERNIQRLQRCEDFLGLQFRSHQIFYVHKFALDRLGIDIPINRLAIAFNFPPTTMKRTLKNGLKPPKQCDRHNALPEDSQPDILAWIQHQAEKSQPSTRTNILHYCSSNFGKGVTREPVGSS